MSSDHSADVQRYIDGVLDGSIVTGRLQRLAVHRHVDDLRFAGERGYYFDETIATNAIEFSLCCRHFKGEWAGLPLTLRPEQKFIAWCLFGWRKKSNGFRRFRHAQMELARKAGKALSLDTLLPTPTGWTTMGEVSTGDTLFDENGNQCRVTAVTDVVRGRPCYRVLFSDGTSIVADEEHEWLTTSKYSGVPRAGRKWVTCGDSYRIVAVDEDGREVSGTKIRTTAEIRDTLTVTSGTSRNDRNHRIENCRPLQIADETLPIHPYALGAWLGDGHSASSRFTCAFSDSQILEEIAACGVSVKWYPKGSTATTGLYRLGSDGIRSRSAESMGRTLRIMGLKNNKHIPREYLRASESQRWDLLRGLMDTDGCASHRNRKCEFTSTNRRLAEETLELMRSLGLKPTLSSGRATIYGRDCGAKYRITFSAPVGAIIFRLKRKQEQVDSKPCKPCNSSRAIVSVEPVPSVPVRCIEVDSPSHLYLAGEGMVPTHNSTLIAYIVCLLMYADCPFEPAAEGVCVATQKEQARTVWDMVSQMVKQSPDLNEMSRILHGCHEIRIPDCSSWFKPLAIDENSGDSFSLHILVKDEEHAYRSQHRKMMRALGSGFGARRQPLSLTITTYGDDKSEIWKGNHDYAVKIVESVISGNVIDDSWFVFIAALDYPLAVPCFRCKGDACPWCGGTGTIQPDDPFDERSWFKANPGLPLCPKIDVMRADANEAQHKPDKKLEFFQKNLNIIVASSARVISAEVWNTCTGELSDWSLASDIHGGFDLGATDDLASVGMVAVFDEIDDDGEPFHRYEVKSRSFISEDRPEHMQKEFIERWIREGRMHLSDGPAVDLNEVENFIVECSEETAVSTWAHDRTMAKQMGQTLVNKHGLQDFEFTQSAYFYAEPLKQFLSLIQQTRVVNGKKVRLIRHDGDPVLAWQATNLIVRYNAKGEGMPDKTDPENKIDAMVALLMAFSECLYAQEEFPEMSYSKGGMLA